MAWTNTETSLTPEQLSYVRENYKKTSGNKMSKVLGIAQSKISYNMALLKLQHPVYRKDTKVPDIKLNGFFCVTDYKNWLL